MRVGELRVLIDGLDDDVTIVIADSGDWLHVEKVLDPRRDAALIWLTIYPSTDYAGGREEGFFAPECSTCDGFGRGCPDCGWCEVCRAHLYRTATDAGDGEVWRDPTGWFECWGEDHAGRTGQPHVRRAWGEEGAPI